MTSSSLPLKSGMCGENRGIPCLGPGLPLAPDGPRENSTHSHNFKNKFE